MGELRIELVPSTCWYTNVRSNVSRRDWEKCKQFVKQRSGDRCEICGGRGSRWPVECHEIWDYDDERSIQTLVGLIALCPRCHEVKHIGRASVVGTLDRALVHLARVNEWPMLKARKAYDIALQIWEIRSQYQWELDITFLEMLGISPSAKV